MPNFKNDEPLESVCPECWVLPLLKPLVGLRAASAAVKGAEVTGQACKTAAKELTADGIRAINRTFGGATELTGSADTVIANMAYREGIEEQTATAIRDIAGRHLFDNGNKRTAQAVAESLLGPGTNPETIRSVIDQVATGILKDVSDIAKALSH